MDISRRNLALGLITLPAIMVLSACNTKSNGTSTDPNTESELSEVTTKELTAQLGNDKLTADFLIPFINDACFNMALTPTNVNNINAVVAYSFGNRPNDSSDPNVLAEPGPMNKDLADCCAKIYRMSPVPLYVQWEIARHLDTTDYDDIPSRDIIAIEPYWNNNGDLIYLSTEGVAKAIIDTYFAGDASAIGTVGIVGHRDHAKRCLLTSKSVGMKAFHVSGIELPVWYDDLSNQPWTRKRELYVFQDIASQIYTQSQKNILLAYPS